MTVDQETRILRHRLASLRSAMDRAQAGGPAFASARQLVRVFQETKLPSSTGVYYACNPCDVDGAEQEGSASSFNCDSSTTLYVDFIGSSPSSGDMAVATATGGRWVAANGGGNQGRATIRVVGCSNLPYQGCTVTVYDKEGGNKLGSGTTDKNGEWQFPTDHNVSCCPITYWVTISEPTGRFQPFAQAVTLGCFLVVIALVPAAGYHCCPPLNCVLPLKDTIRGSDSVLGGATLTYQTAGRFQGQWFGTSDYNYPGYTDPLGSIRCFGSETTPPAPWGASLTLGWLLCPGVSVNWCCDNNGFCPAPFSPLFGCNSPCTPNFCGSSTDITTTLSCPPSFEITQTLTFNGLCNGVGPFPGNFDFEGNWADYMAAMYGKMAPRFPAVFASQLVWTIAPGTTYATRTFTE